MTPNDYFLALLAVCILVIAAMLFRAHRRQVKQIKQQIAEHRERQENFHRRQQQSRNQSGLARVESGQTYLNTEHLNNAAFLHMNLNHPQTEGTCRAPKVESNAPESTGTYSWPSSIGGSDYGSSSDSSSSSSSSYD